MSSFDLNQLDSVSLVGQSQQVSWNMDQRKVCSGVGGVELVEWGGLNPNLVSALAPFA